MKHVLLILTVILMMTPAVYSQDFYDIDSINTIEITFQESNWDYLLDVLEAAGNEERLIGTAVINGVTFDSVGVRYKGNSSFSSDRTKNPLNIKLDHIIDDQLYQNYGTLKLANVFKDPSFVREVLGYEIARNYMPASKANYINVYINGSYIGLYTNVQSVDKYMLGTFFYDNDNPLFKGELIQGSTPPGCPIGPPQCWGYLNDDSTCYYNYYEIKSDSGWYDLIGFLDTLNNYDSYLENVLDIDGHLWMLAFDILMVNLDAPVSMPHNFYVYKNYTNQFSPMIWDLNECFGGFSRIAGGPGSPPLSTTEMQQLDPFVHLYDADYPIISKVLPNESYQKMYIAHMKTIMEEQIENGLYETRAGEIQDIIDADVQGDANKFYTYSDFLNNITSTAGGVAGLAEIMDARAIYLNSQPEFLATPPNISNIACSPASPTANSTVWFTVDVSNTSTVTLGYRQILTGKFDKVQMYDDGSHNDGTAGDGTFGVSVDIGTGDIHYYIYAENSDAGAFSPERAEFEFYIAEVTGTASSDIYINEFLASNTACYADQNGEFDDWVELYNSADSVISLEGYYLSDDLVDITQWEFPDTFIEANGYLLIWADEDEEQTGLHTNFKLSASGESIVLVNPEQSIIDEITFGAQTEDISHGRYPDGVDFWRDFVVPTPGASNTLALNTPPVFEWTIYSPNPPTSSDPVSVVTMVTDDGVLSGVDLMYDAGSGYIALEMYDDGSHNDSLAADNIYGAFIPALPDLTTVSFYIEATDDSSAVTLDPSSSQYQYQVIDQHTVNVYINEFMADNDTTIVDPDGSGGYPDWIELYNAGDSTVNLEGMYLTDDLSEPTMWMIPAGVSIDAGDYLLFWADNDEVQGVTHTNFKLGASGEAIGLFDSDAHGNTAIDMITFGEQSADISYGRCPDGSGDWEYFDPASPGEPNCVESYECGDANNDGAVNVSDAVWIINYVFVGGAPPDPFEAGEANCDGAVNVSDAVWIINYVFVGGNDPCDTDGDSEPDC